MTIMVIRVHKINFRFMFLHAPISPLYRMKQG